MFSSFEDSKQTFGYWVDEIKLLTAGKAGLVTVKSGDHTKNRTPRTDILLQHNAYACPRHQSIYPGHPRIHCKKFQFFTESNYTPISLYKKYNFYMKKILLDLESLIKTDA